MLECPKTAQMKDFLKLFKTVMDFKGLSFIVTEQPFNKKLRPVFYFATVKKYGFSPLNDSTSPKL